MLTETILPGRIIAGTAFFLMMALCSLTGFAQGSTVANVLRVSLVQGPSRDEIVVHFTAGATNGFDNDADAWKICNGTFDIFSLLADGSKLSINSLPPLDSEAVVQLAIDAFALGDYQIEFAALESFPDSVAIVLHDKFISKRVDVRVNETYLFKVSQDTLSTGSRFELIFSYQHPVTGPDQGHSAVITQLPENNRESFSVYPNPVTDELFVEIENAHDMADIPKVYNGQGQPLGKIELYQELGTMKGQFTMQNYPAGIYFVRYLSDDKIVDARVIKK